MFDVFYIGPKPDLFAHEQQVENIEQAQQLTRTRFFWLVSYLVDYTGFDFLYEPPPWQSEYTHVWPSQHHEYSGTYLVPAAGEIKYHFHGRIVPNKQQLESFDILTDSEFDFTWAPHPHDPPYIYVFGNQWYPANIMPTVEYHVPGAAERKYMDLPRARLPVKQTDHWHTLVKCEWDYSWVPDPGDPPLIYVFGNQWWPAEKMPTVQYHVPGATERKYMTWPRAQLLPDQSRWTVPPNIADVDFSWVPDPGEPPYIYQFATQHQKTGGPVYTVPGSTEVKYLAELKILTVGNATAIYEIDHLDGAAGQIPNVTRRVRYFDNYRDTLIRLAKSIGSEHEFVWVCSSICDYTNFDFSWHPEQWQADMLHVFASDEQKFGDTFFMHVPSFAARAETVELLDWYDCNFVDRSVPRRPMPVIHHDHDSHVDAVLTQDFVGPLAIFTTKFSTSRGIRPPAVSLWREKTKTIVPLSPSAASVIVPKVAIPYIRTQLYDYPKIDKTHCDDRIDTLMDVIFISYDEPDAEQNWNILAQQCARAKRVHGVAGMETALEAAADLSSTPWYYAVFAKTRLHEQFNFSYVPDRMQQPKHYIFECINTVNGLQYGHMGVVMYNCEGIRTLNQAKNFGLDYTLSFAHESVPILSCYGDFDQTPYHTWRTAFRECAKLAYFESQSPTVDGEYRLNTWLSRAQGNHAEWCLKGAHDGVEFFKASDQELATLKQSFRWEWLREYFMSRYGDLQ